VFACMRACVHACVLACLRACMHEFTRDRACMHAMHARMRTEVYMRVGGWVIGLLFDPNYVFLKNISKCTCTHAKRTHACMYACTHACTHVCTHTHLHIRTLDLGYRGDVCMQLTSFYSGPIICPTDTLLCLLYNTHSWRENVAIACIILICHTISYM
jgi:hypothetical protein